jgi:hypothetical protein
VTGAAPIEAEGVRKTARIAALREERPKLLKELGRAIQAVVAARRAFAAAVDGVVELVGQENDRSAELRQLGQREPATDLDVVRHAIGQLIERDAPAEYARLDLIPARLLSMVDGLALMTSDEFEPALMRVRNEFSALAGPTVADFAAPQPMPLSADTSDSALNARSAAALLREIEESP